MSTMQKISCGFLIMSKGKFLVTHSTNGNEPVRDDDNRWGFPKGLKERDVEDDVLCAVRELREETGLDLRQYDVEVESTPFHTYKVGNKEVRIYLVIDKANRIIDEMVFKCESIVSGLGIPEVDAIRWIDWNEGAKLCSRSASSLFTTNSNPADRPVVVREGRGPMTIEERDAYEEEYPMEFYEERQAFERSEFRAFLCIVGLVSLMAVLCVFF